MFRAAPFILTAKARTLFVVLSGVLNRVASVLDVASSAFDRVASTNGQSEGGDKQCKSTFHNYDSLFGIPRPTPLTHSGSVPAKRDRNFYATSQCIVYAG